MQTIAMLACEMAVKTRPRSSMGRAPGSELRKRLSSAYHAEKSEKGGVRVPAIALEKAEVRALNRICAAPQRLSSVAPEVCERLVELRLIEVSDGECRITLRGQLETLRQEFRDIQRPKYYAVEIGETVTVHSTRRQFEKARRSRLGGRVHRLLQRLIGR